MMKFYQQYNNLNEARVTRTIDSKLWASVSSGCSKTYKNDLGASAKPIGTRDQLLQRFVAGLIILKQQCPITEKDLQNCPAFPQWANKLLDMGVSMAEIHKLWNENCGKLPQVDTTTVIDNNTGNIIDEEPEENDEFINEPETINNINDNIDDESVENDEITTPTNNRELNAMPSNNQEMINVLHKIMIKSSFNRNQGLFELHGCNNPTDAITPLNNMQLNKEGIVSCENLDDLINIASERNLLFVMRVLGGDPEEVKGDIVYYKNDTLPSYYIAIGNTSVKIYYKEDNGELSLSYLGSLNEFGLSNN